MPVSQDPVPERMARHGFATRPARSVVESVRLTTAIQAQDAAAARLGVRSRSVGVTDADVQRALDDERAIVRTWLMRATIHLVTAEDVRWLTALLGPGFSRKFAKRWADIGLTPRLLARTADRLPDVLSGGPLPLSEILAGLAERGIRVPPTDPQAGYHVLLHATGLGLVCRGPQRGREASFALLDQWLPDVPPGPRGEDALTELARRYFAAFSPATAADFTAWSGLPSSRAIALVRDELSPVEVAGRPGFRLGESASVDGSAPARVVRLLGAFDNYLVGYRERSPLIDPAHRPRVYVGGVIKPTVLLDGRVIGTWQLNRTRVPMRATIRLFDPPTSSTRRAVTAEVEDIRRFLGGPVECVIE